MPPDAPFDDAAAPPPSGAAFAWTIAVATVCFHVLTSAGYGYFRDELYYLACSDHLAAGYVDHPPLLELVLRVLRPVLGDSRLALRLLPAMAAGAAVLVTAASVRAFGGGRRATVVAAILVATAPIFVGTFAILTPNALDVVLWTAILLLVARALLADPRGWVAAGALVGLGFENKHGMAFLALGLAVGFALTPTRREWRNGRLWIGLLLAAALALPHLVWQATHGWPTLEFMANARRLKHLEQSPLAVVAEQVLIVNPVAAPVWLAGLVWLWHAEHGRLRMLAWAYATVVVLLIVGRGKAYYATPFYPTLFAAGAVAIERSRRWSWLTIVVPALALVVGAIAAPLAKPLLEEKTLIRYASSLHQDPRLGVDERSVLGVLPQHFADQHGWPELAATVADVYRGLPAADRDRACIFASNYGEAAAIDFFGRAAGLPPAVSGHNAYWLWGPRDCSFDVVVVVGLEPADVAAYARSVETAATFVCPYCMPFENKPILVTRGLIVSRDALWSQVKRYL